MLDTDLRMTPAWHYFFLALYARTGGGTGTSAETVQANLDTSNSQLSAIDTTLQNNINAEAHARATGDTNEANARFAEDTALQNAKYDKTGGAVSGDIVGAASVTGAWLRTAGTGGPTWTAGFGVPASNQPVGSLYSNMGGSTGSTLYVSRGGGVWAGIA